MSDQNNWTQEELQEIQAQLAHPTGQKGIEVGNHLNKSNQFMTERTMDFLNIMDDQSVLEIGHGNARHLSEVLAKASNVKYYGLEISETMFQEAQKINGPQITNSQAEFRLYDGQQIPFPEKYFDRIMTVNTLYFWPNPLEFLNEMGRCMKAKGECVVCFAKKEFMKELPFTGRNFRLYSNEDFQKMAANSVLDLLEVVDQSDHTETKTGQWVERKFSLAKLTKS